MYISNWLNPGSNRRSTSEVKLEIMRNFPSLWKWPMNIDQTVLTNEWSVIWCYVQTLFVVSQINILTGKHSGWHFTPRVQHWDSNAENERNEGNERNKRNERNTENERNHSGENLLLNAHNFRDLSPWEKEVRLVKQLGVRSFDSLFDDDVTFSMKDITESLIGHEYCSSKELSLSSRLITKITKMKVLRNILIEANFCDTQETWITQSKFFEESKCCVCALNSSSTSWPFRMNRF